MRCCGRRNFELSHKETDVLKKIGFHCTWLALILLSRAQAEDPTATLQAQIAEERAQLARQRAQLEEQEARLERLEEAASRPQITQQPQPPGQGMTAPPSSSPPSTAPAAAAQPF